MVNEFNLLENKILESDMKKVESNQRHSKNSLDLSLEVSHVGLKKFVEMQ